MGGWHDAERGGIEIMAYSAAPVQAVNIAGTAAALAKTATAGAGLTGAAGVFGAAIPIIGLAAVAAPFVSNLIQCGTIGQVGCQKVSDSTNSMNIQAAAQAVAYAVQQGQITSSQGTQQLQQLAQTASTAFNNPQRSWLSPFTFKNTLCGSWTNNGKAETGIPCNSAAALAIPAGTVTTGPGLIQSYINWVQQQPAPMGSPAASANPLATLSASVGSTGIPTWLLLAGGAAVLFLILGVVK